MRAGAVVIVLNRTLSRAERLCSDIAGLAGGAIQALPLNEGNLKKALGKSALLVNASSLGMHPQSSESPAPKRLLRRDLAVFDIIYNPLPTRLAREAEEIGAKVATGLEMLVRQGALSFEIWTGQKAPLATMRQAALEALKQNES